MKEKIFNQVIFFIFIFLLLVASLNCFLIAFRVIPQEYLVNVINYYLNVLYTTFTNQVLLALVGFLLFFISLYLIWFKRNRVKGLSYVKVSTGYGEMKISTLSLEQIILNILSHIKDIRKMKPEIRIQKNGSIKVILQLMVSPDCNIPQTAYLIQQTLKEALPKVSGIEPKEIKINVDKIDYQGTESSK